MDDCDKTQDQLIAELELLRREVVALKQARHSETHRQPTTPEVPNLTIAPCGSLTDNVEVTGQYTVLLIDDSEVDRATYRRFLMEDRARTYQIVEFDNGEDALEWCQQNISDIFLLDYFLPDMDGLEFLQQLQQQTGRDTLPVIMFTGQGNIQIAVDLLKKGAQDYLEKSQITAQVLQRSISYILRHNQLIREREWQQQQQQLLAKTALSIRESLKLEDILNTTVREVRNILQCDRVIIFKFSPDWGGEVLVESVADGCMAILPLLIYDPCIGKEYAEPFKKGLITAKSDIYNSGISPCHIEFLESLKVRANLVVPIVKGDQLWGLLAAHHCTGSRPWQPSEIELLKQVVTQAGIAIQQADLFEQLQAELRERQLAEIALQENEQKLQLFIKYAPASIVMFDREIRYLAASQRWVDDFQLNSSESIIGRSHYEVFPNISEQWKHYHQSCLAGAIEKCDEDFFVSLDGSEQWLRWEIHPWYRSNGDIGGIMLFSENISDRKQAQIALQKLNSELEQRVIERTVELTEVNDRLLVTLLEKEHAYQRLEEQAQLLDLAHESIITWDLNSVITFWNQGAEVMYGWTKAEAFGQELHAFLKTQFPQPFAEIQAELLENGYWEGELIHVTKDDRRITVSSSWVVQKDHAGRAIKILEINNDITARKQAESLLQQYITQVEDLYNNAPCGYHSLDAAGTIIMINDTELKWLGYTRDEIVHQKKFVDLMTIESKNIFSQDFILFKQQGWINNVELQILNKNRKLIWVNLNATAIYDEAGNFIMSRSSVFDITDRKLTEAAFRQYERLVFNTKDGIALLNINYIYQIANQGYLDWCNKSESEVIGNSVRNILGAELFDNFIKPRLDRCLGGETIQYEKWFDSPNLVPQFLSVTYTPFRDAGENISGVIVSLRDLTQLKQKEQMLDLQAVITRNMAEGICLVRADNAAIVYANPKFEQMFGYDFGELNGQHVSILNYATASVSPEDVNQAIRSAVLQNSEFSYEVHNVKKDGTPFWCSATCSVFKHSDYGDVLVAVHQDITVAKHLEEVRQEAEAALLQKSRKENLLWRITQGIRQSLDLNAVLNTAVTEITQTLQTDRTAIYRFNADWSGDFVVESVGEGWVKLVGGYLQKVCEDVYLQETQGGRFRNHEIFAIADIGAAGLHPCHVQLLEQFQAKAYMAVPIFSGEFLWGLLIIYQNTGPRNWQSWEIELLEQIASQLAIGIQQSQLYRQLQVELQERQQAEATIREAERRWRSLLDNVQLIVVGLDLDANVNYVNPFFLRITGYTHPEVMGKNWFENFLPPSNQQSVQVVFSEVLAHNYHPYYQNFILTKSGEERFIAWNNTMLQDSEGNIIGTISIGEDITDRQKLEHIKNEFIGIVSHELRTPLAGIQMSLGLIKSGVYDKKPEKSKRMIEIALLDTNRLVHLVNDILDLERLDSGRAIVEKTVCKAADLMQQAVDSMQALATQQQISLIVNPTDAEVGATRDAIVQTLTNLLSNAIKFSPPDSTIHLSAENQTDFVLFQVSDGGRGIPADKLELIFGRFQQVDASDSREKGGTGLGLAICRSIVEQHGGKIWAESILGEGSTFCFTLPLPIIE